MRIEQHLVLPLMVFLLIPKPGLLAASEEKKPPTPQELVHASVRELVKIQEDNGNWSYEALHRDEDEEEGLPLGFQVGGTSIVAEALLFAAPDDKDAQTAVQKALAFVLKRLEHPKMAPLTEEAYDVRIWGHTFALDFLCQIRARKAAGKYEAKVRKWIPRLVKTLIKEEIPGGGWSYADHTRSATFVTAPVTQSLLLARSQDEKVPDELLTRCRKVLEKARMEDGAFVYHGSADDEEIKSRPGSTLGGSSSRGLVCETTLVLLGGSSIDRVRFALKNFFDHADDLEDRRQKSGTHEGPYNIAPYYFYYGHRYAAQAIQMLPEKERAKEYERLLKPILQTRDEDGTWNDRVFERARYVDTAFVILTLLGDKTPLPPKMEKK